MAGKKRIALFFDGTWNSVEDNTNIWRLRSLCAEEDAQGTRQLAYYDTGVGTRFGERIRGGAFGYGLGVNVCAAYRWLIERYASGDDVFIFGFSRGAFTARSVAGLIARCGLLQPGAPMSVDQVFDRYMRNKEAPALYRLAYLQRQGHQDFTPEERALLRYSIRIPIQFIGVFDTVGSLGVPFGNIPGISSTQFLFHNTNLSNLYKRAYQALALDEHRGPYEPTLWTRYTPPAPNPPPEQREPAGDQVVEQRWFIGAHANIGGGYRNDRLAQIPLAWLAAKAQDEGLAFRFPVTLDEGMERDPVTDSYSEFLYGAYKLATFGRRSHRTVGRPPRRTKDGGWSTTIQETIDGTVLARWRADPSYRPPGLDEWAKRRGVDLAQAQGAVSAIDGQPFA